jgi:hypothetical protein
MALKFEFWGVTDTRLFYLFLITVLFFLSKRVIFKKKVVSRRAWVVGVVE